MNTSYGGYLTKADPDDALRIPCECGAEVFNKCASPRCDAGICEAHETLCEECGKWFCQKCCTLYAYGEFFLCAACMRTVPAQYERDNPRNEIGEIAA